METTPSRRTLSAQDQRLAADLVEWERSVETARDDADVLAGLATAEYGPDDLDAVLARVESAQAGFEARARAMGAEDAAVDARRAAFASARKSYRAFRKLAKSTFRADRDARTALGLTDPTPRALADFAAHVRAGYTAAATEPYLSRLGRGYTAERLQALVAEADDLVRADGAVSGAESRAEAATAARDAEADAARDAFGEYRDVAQATLPPDLLARLELD